MLSILAGEISSTAKFRASFPWNSVAEICRGNFPRKFAVETFYGMFAVEGFHGRDFDGILLFRGFRGFCHFVLSFVEFPPSPQTPVPPSPGVDPNPKR